MSTSSRKFLLYCPTNKGDQIGDFFGDNRLFDVALHDFSGDTYHAIPEAEHMFAGKGHKWGCIQKNMENLKDKYEFYAFFDNDIEVTTDQLNALFLAGKKHQLDLFQASLTWDSVEYFDFLYRNPLSLRPWRRVPFVEIMMPIFSHQSLQTCLPTFSETESGYGLDLLWAKMLRGKKLGIVDSIAVRHASPIVSDGWVLSNGKTAHEELFTLMEKHQIDPSIIERSSFSWSRFCRKYSQHLTGKTHPIFQ